MSPVNRSSRLKKLDFR